MKPNRAFAEFSWPLWGFAELAREKPGRCRLCRERTDGRDTWHLECYRITHEGLSPSGHAAWLADGAE